MEIRFVLTPEDIAAYARQTRLSAPRRGNALPLALIACGFGSVLLPQADLADWRGALLLINAALLGLAGLAYGLWRGIAGRVPGAEIPIGPHTLAVTSMGLALGTAEGVRFLASEEIPALEETPDFFHLHPRRGPALVLPKRAWPSPGDAEGFKARLIAHRQAHPGHPDRGLLAGIWAALREGYRLAVFKPVDGGAGQGAGAGVLVALLALRLGQSALGDYVAARPEPRFDPYGLIDHGAGLLLFLLSGVILGGLARDPTPTPRLLALIAAAEWLTSAMYRLAYAGLGPAPDATTPWAAWALFLIWLVWNSALVFRAAGLVYRQPAPAALFLASAFAFLNWGIGFQLPKPEIFYPAQGPEATATAPAIDAEEVLYRQHRLLREATDALAPERPGIADLYFMGFAGEADEHVFAHEVEYAKDLFDRRFDTQGRSVALINSPDSADRRPIATGHSLDTALQAVAKRMNPREDVLFLFLTSHGSRDHKLSVRFAPLPLDDLPAAKLKALLDRSGIRHRVIVVSACYSGGFLDALKDDDSLILTAASRDRASFGCGVESEFTYFGEAYFVEALKKTRSFVEAFGAARAAIEQRERAEGDEPSMPQVHVGKNIAAKLKALERRLAALPD